jgi:DNA-binding PadR family transcriptional regulator
MSGRGRSNPLALAVLGCLYERSMHPYEMATTMRNRAKHESIKLNYGSLYTVVESLQRRGLIEPVETVREGRRPERTVYAITQAGRVEFVDWLSELIGVPVKEYTQFEAGLSLLAALPPDDAVAMLEQRRMQLAMALRQMRSVLALAAEEGLPRLFSIEAEYRVALHEAELEWVEKLIGEITNESLDGLDIWRGFHTESASSSTDSTEGRRPAQRPEPT